MILVVLIDSYDYRVPKIQQAVNRPLLQCPPNQLYVLYDSSWQAGKENLTVELSCGNDEMNITVGNYKERFVISPESVAAVAISHLGGRHAPNQGGPASAFQALSVNGQPVAIQTVPRIAITYDQSQWQKVSNQPCVYVGNTERLVTMYILHDFDSRNQRLHQLRAALLSKC